MRSKLFRKILLAYAVTFFLVVQAVGLVFLARDNIERDSRNGPGPPPQIVAAQAVLESGGVEAFNAYRAKLPARARDNLVLTSYDRSAGEADSSPGSRLTTTPDGQSYILGFKDLRPGGPRSSLLPPWEILVVGALGGLAFSAALAFYLTIPIDKLRSGFARLAAGELDVRVGSSMGRRSDEIALLGKDFDSMARRLQSLVDARVRLLHDVSHEFRSPLARVHMAASLIEQSPANTERCLKRINLEVEHLNSLVEELLTLTRIEAGGLSAELEEFDLLELIQSVLTDAQFEAGDRPDRLQLETYGLPCSGPAPKVLGDTRLIGRAFENILRNALKFSPPSEPIEIDLVLALDMRQYSIEVRDHGPGVEPDMLQTMFDPFVRHSAKAKGYGLGLAIAKRAVEAHGGTIEARTNDPAGLSVFIKLPTT